MQLIIYLKERAKILYFLFPQQLDLLDIRDITPKIIDRQVICDNMVLNLSKEFPKH